MDHTRCQPTRTRTGLLPGAQSESGHTHGTARHGGAQRLCRQPAIGRPGAVGGTREWRVARTPYLLVYRQGVDALEVLHVWHEAQDWMSRTE
ncbi:type II toxin-antitoxin system RelE/ParE family toxin [Pseudoxanthomonas spadix]|uniref:type II toxin-antitoxin system RelE/ParE family toxin n=1 Tax=Pseudoxanthomonas spadix TaxID=415229 RepID=UPI0009FDFB69